jgi:hypothetical protein
MSSEANPTPGDTAAELADSVRSPTIPEDGLHGTYALASGAHARTDLAPPVVEQLQTRGHRTITDQPTEEAHALAQTGPAAFAAERAPPRDSVLSDESGSQRDAVDQHAAQLDMLTS